MDAHLENATYQLTNACLNGTPILLRIPAGDKKGRWVCFVFQSPSFPHAEAYGRTKNVVPGSHVHIFECRNGCELEFKVVKVGKGIRFEGRFKHVGTKEYTDFVCFSPSHIMTTAFGKDARDIFYLGIFTRTFQEVLKRTLIHLGLTVPVTKLTPPIPLPSLRDKTSVARPSARSNKRRRQSPSAASAAEIMESPAHGQLNTTTTGAASSTTDNSSTPFALSASWLADGNSLPASAGYLSTPRLELRPAAWLLENLPTPLHFLPSLDNFSTPPHLLASAASSGQYFSPQGGPAKKRDVFERDMDEACNLPEIW